MRRLAGASHRTGTVGIAVLLALAAGAVACGSPDGPGEGAPAPSPAATATGTETPSGAEAAPPPPALPASAAGGACHLLDYPAVFDYLGLAFDVSAARERKDAHTCVVRATTRQLPDLALTVVPTSTGVDDFTEDLLPDGADELDRLGVIGYHQRVKATKSRGPGHQVVWLSGDGRLLTLALTLPSDADRADAAAYQDRLVELARAVDRRRI